jgi:hypothetical protein
MTNRDRFTDLCRRLESFPRELGPFFKHILDSVEPIYHAKMATMLQIALTATKPLHIFMYDFHDLEHDDEYYYRPRHIEALPVAELSEVRSRITYYLDSRTRGLLEVSNSREVTFLHRTVKDYLADQALAGFPKVNLPRGSCREFSPQLSILRAYAAWVKSAAPDVLCRLDFAEYSGNEATDGITPSILELTTDLIPYAVQLDPQSPYDSRIGEVLGDIDSSIATLISRTRSPANSSREEGWNEDKLLQEHGIGVDRLAFQRCYAWGASLFFRECLAKAGVTNYVAAQNLQEPTTREPQVDERSLSDKQHRCTQKTQFKHLRPRSRLFRCLWKVYMVIFRWFLFCLYSFTLPLSSFLIRSLPSFLSQWIIIPFMSTLAKFVYGNDYWSEEY